MVLVESSFCMAQILYAKRKEEVKATPLPNGDLVLFNQTTDWANTVNPLASMVWELSDGLLPVDEIAREIRELLPNMQIDQEEFCLQLHGLITELAEAGFLELSDNPFPTVK